MRPREYILVAAASKNPCELGKVVDISGLTDEVKPAGTEEDGVYSVPSKNILRFLKDSLSLHIERRRSGPRSIPFDPVENEAEPSVIVAVSA